MFATLIPHGNLQGGAAYAVFMGVCILVLVVYGLYLTFGPGKENLRDQIDEHAKMHELGIAHGHGGSKDAYEMSGKLDDHTHDEVK
tara:strand:+ start:191 stop:448 length:258 start_codon:yes stop_codon:yes gene_type:complete